MSTSAERGDWGGGGSEDHSPSQKQPPSVKPWTAPEKANTMRTPGARAARRYVTETRRSVSQTKRRFVRPWGWGESGVEEHVEW